MAIMIMVGALIYAGMEVALTKREAINPFEFAFVGLVAVVAAIRSLKE